VGVYGLTAFVISKRTRDIGIRLALGASPCHIAKSIARRGLLLLASGIVVGLLGAYALTRVFATLLFGVSSSDIFTFAGATILLTLVAVAAMVGPVRMAIRLDPVSAICSE
jgi:putative ABC transport system permease protein